MKMRLYKPFMRVLTFLVLINLSFQVTITFPLFKQCDEKWGNDIMGVKGHVKEDDTICHQGCAMSSVAMFLAGYGINFYDQNETITPKNLNNWLRNNEGYHCISGDCCNLVLNSIENIKFKGEIRCLGEPKKPFLKTLKEFVLNENIVVIAHVRNGHHFVLLVGINSDDSFLVNDPGFDQQVYYYDDISDVIVYNIVLF